MSEVAPPVPDPKLTPKSADEMAREGEREAEVLVEPDHSQSTPDDGELSSPTLPTTPPTGD